MIGAAARGSSPSWSAARANPALVRFTLTHALSVVAEWASFIGVLVYAYDEAGEVAAGLASLAILTPYVVVTPFGVSMAERRHPASVRFAFFIVQAVMFTVAAAGAVAGAPVVLVVAACSAGLSAIAIIRPTSAILIPSIVRSTDQLTTANVWFGWCEGGSVFLGPLLATVLLAAGGAPAALAGCAVLTFLSAIGAAITFGSERAIAVARHHPSESVVALTLRSLGIVLRLDGGLGIVLVAGGQFVLVGAFDLLFVVIAEDRLGLGGSGPGLLSTAFGLGALSSLGLAGALVRRRRLSTLLSWGLGVIAVGCLALAATTDVVLALAVLPWLGLSRSLLDVSARMLMQRSAAPAELGGVFAILEMLTGVGMVTGSLVAQVLLAAGSATLALAVLGIGFALLLVGTVGSLRRVEAAADVPVVAIGLLQQLAAFQPLPPDVVEMVARQSAEREVEVGEHVVRQGAPGDFYYAVADGRFDVVIDGAYVRTVGRGGGFGEIALLTEIPRTADVVCVAAGRVIALDRVVFLQAVLGSEAARTAVWRAVAELGPIPGIDPAGPTAH